MFILSFVTRLTFQKYRVKLKIEKASNAVLDAVDDFCDQIDQLNEAADSYAERHNKQG